MFANRKLFITTLVALATGLACGGNSSNGATHSISGTITGESAAVTLTLSGAKSATTTTDASGKYSFTGLANGSYTVTPSKPGYTCSPASRDVTVNGADVTGQDFTAAATHSISGTVSGATGLSVTITLTSGSGTLTTTADLATGAYSFTGLAGGSYTVAASLAGYRFSPASIPVDVNSADATGRDFTATLITFAVSGTVSELAEDGVTRVGVSGATVTLAAAGAAPETFTTGTDGAYAFDVVPGDYTVSAAKGGYTMSAALPVHVADADVPGQDFTATLNTYSISGAIVDGSSAPLSGVSVILSRGGQNLRSTSTDGAGHYAFPGLAPGFTYGVTPSSPSYAFTPLDVPLAAANVTDANFTGTLIQYTISGTVTEAGTSILSPDLSVNYASVSGTAHPCQMNGNGTYTCTVVPGTYMMAPTLNGKAFYPASLTVTVAANVSGQDFHVGEWKWQNPLPQGNSISAAWGTDASNVWLVGGSGAILHWTGAALETVASGTKYPLSGVWGSSGSDIWAVGGAGTILHRNASGWQDASSQDGGATKVTTSHLASVWGSGQDDVWAVGSAGTILHRDANGWHDVSSQDGGLTRVTSNQLNAVWGSGPTDVWAVGEAGTILHMDNANGLWRDVSIQGGVPVTANILYGAWGSGPTDVWAVGAAGTILHLGNDGLWQDVTGQEGAPVTTYDILGVWGIGGEVWAAMGGASGSTILHRSNGAWTQSTVTGFVRTFWGSAATDLWAVGSYGNILRSQNGADWTSQWSALTTQQLNAIWASGPDEAWAVGDGATILHFTNGDGWTLTAADALKSWMNLWGVWGSSPNDVWVVGGGIPPGSQGLGTAVILHWGSNGWEDHSYTGSGTTLSQTRLSSVWGSGPGDVWAVGTSNNALNNKCLHWNGATWEALTTTSSPPKPPTKIAFSQVWGSGKDDVWITGSGSIYHYNGTAWQTIPIGASYVWGSGPNDVWFVGGSGSMWHSSDGVNVTSWPSSPTTYTFESLWGSGANDVWAYDMMGGLWHWNGSVWDGVTLPGGNELNLGGSGPSGLWAVGQGGAILRWQ